MRAAMDVAIQPLGHRRPCRARARGLSSDRVVEAASHGGRIRRAELSGDEVILQVVARWLAVESVLSGRRLRESWRRRRIARGEGRPDLRMLSGWSEPVESAARSIRRAAAAWPGPRADGERRPAMRSRVERAYSTPGRSSTVSARSRVAPTKVLARVDRAQLESLMKGLFLVATRRCLSADALVGLPVRDSGRAFVGAMRFKVKR